MKKNFNITGSCIPEVHYMVDISPKLSRIFNMVEHGDYFVINRPRQYGKTTTLNMLDRFLKNTDEYFSIPISFESIGEEGFESVTVFSKEFLHLLIEEFSYLELEELVAFIKSEPVPTSFLELNSWIGKLVRKIGKKTVLMIDEVGKSSNNQLFLDFLGMLRNKYLNRTKPGAMTFLSVILAGVHDVKTLKVKLRPDEEAKFNSPWNIAVDFNVNLSFSSNEIETMLRDYSQAEQVSFDIPLIAEKLFYFTSGYPFLVSYLCKIIHEEILPSRTQSQWFEEDLDKAVQILVKKDTTNFDSLIKNLSNNPELYDLVFKIVMNDGSFQFNRHNEVIALGILYGILREDEGKAVIHNRVYEQVIYNYMISRLETSGEVNFSYYNTGSSYIEKNSGLNLETILKKFQQFMAEQYSLKDKDFIERNGRLLFLTFLRPIINGKGFDFKEVQVSEERRIDIIVTFENKKYIIELKIWRGESYHKEGIRQLSQYLERQHETSGYLIIYDLRKEKGQTGKIESIDYHGKKILAAWV